MSSISSSGFLVQPSNIDTNRVAFKATSPEYYIDSSLNFAIQTKFNITNWASSAPFFISFHASNVFFQASPWYGFGIHKYGTYMRLTVFDEETNGAFGVNNHYNLGGSISELSSFQMEELMRQCRYLTTKIQMSFGRILILKIVQMV